MTGTVFNIMRYALHDGPGIRTVVFLKGCPLACRWCHNPESQKASPELMIMQGRCVRCGACVLACPNGAAVLSDNGPEVTDACTACGRCAEACLSGARTIAGSAMTVEDVMVQLTRDRMFFEQSGGGVTVSGGEPFGQSAFLEQLLRACADTGIPVAVETCGMAPEAVIARLAGLIGIFLYDIKLMDARRHVAATGVDNGLILSNLAFLAHHGSSVIVRLPVVPGVNDDEDNAAQTVEMMNRLGLRRVDLLPYHQYGVEKYARLGRPCALGDLEPPSAETMSGLCRVFADAGIEVTVGG